MAGSAGNSIVQLTDLPARLIDQPEFANVLDRLREGNEATIDGAWGSSGALAVTALSQQSPRGLVVVLPHEKDVDAFAADAASFGIDPQVFPAWAALPDELTIIDPVLANRLRVLRLVESVAPPQMVITTIHALLQPVPSRDARKVASRTLKVGTDLDLDDLTAWLVGRGFERVTAIELPGEFSIHGGIMDIFSPDTPDPVRIELFGDEIESIRLFNVETQRKVKDLDEMEIAVVTPIVADAEAKTDSRLESEAARQPASALLNSSAIDSLPPTSWIVFVELAEIVSEGKRYLDRLADPRGLFSVESTLERCSRRPHVTLAPLLADSHAPTCHLQVESIERFRGPRGEALQELTRIVQQDETVLIACHNEAARTRLSELMTEMFVGGQGPANDPDDPQSSSRRSRKPLGEISTDAVDRRPLQSKILQKGQNPRLLHPPIHQRIARRCRHRPAAD